MAKRRKSRTITIPADPVGKDTRYISITEDELPRIRHLLGGPGKAGPRKILSFYMDDDTGGTSPKGTTGIGTGSSTTSNRSASPQANRGSPVGSSTSRASQSNIGGSQTGSSSSSSSSSHASQSNRSSSPGGASTSSGSGSGRTNESGMGSNDPGSRTGGQNTGGQNRSNESGMGSNDPGSRQGGQNTGGQQRSANADTGPDNYGGGGQPVGSAQPASDRGPLGPQGQPTGFPGGGELNLAGKSPGSLLGGKPKDQSRIGDEPANTNISTAEARSYPMAPPGMPTDVTATDLGAYPGGMPKANRLAYNPELRERIPGDPFNGPPAQSPPRGDLREPDFTNPGVNETILGKQQQVTDAPVPMNRTPQATYDPTNNVNKLDYMDSEFGIGSFYDPTSVFEGVPKKDRYGAPVSDIEQINGYPGRSRVNPMNEGAVTPEDSPWGFSAPVTEPGAPISPEEINDRRHMGPGLADTTISPAQAKQVAVAEPPSVKDRLEYGLLQSDTALNNRMRQAVNDTMDVPRTVKGDPRQDQLAEQAQMDRAYGAPPGLPGKQDLLGGYPGRGSVNPPNYSDTNPSRAYPNKQNQLSGYPGRGTVTPPNYSDTNPPRVYEGAPQVVNTAAKRNLLGNVAATSPPWETPNWPHPNLPGQIAEADVPTGFNPGRGVVNPPNYTDSNPPRAYPEPPANSSIPTAAENMPTYDPFRDPRTAWSPRQPVPGSGVAEARRHQAISDREAIASQEENKANLPQQPPTKPFRQYNPDLVAKVPTTKGSKLNNASVDRHQYDTALRVEPDVPDVPTDNSPEIEARVEERVKQVKNTVPTDNLPDETVREIVKKHGKDADWISRVLNTFKSLRAAKVHGGEGGKGKHGKRAGLSTAPRLNRRPYNTNVVPPDAPLIA